MGFTNKTRYVDPKEKYMENYFVVIVGYEFLSLVMYPELHNRRKFIHDCWKIAQAANNDEFKKAVSEDKYFYQTRLDCHDLLKAGDDTIISHLLENMVMHKITEDISYKLVSIKKAQVDKNQMTTLKLIDFISVMVQNKRQDQDDYKSKIIFGHKTILKFLKTHHKFVEHD